jgi:hypothetical protein
MMTRASQIWCTRLHGCCQAGTARGSGRMPQPRGQGALYQRECRVIASRERVGETTALAWQLAAITRRPSPSTMRVFAPTFPATAASPPTAVNTRHVPTQGPEARRTADGQGLHQILMTRTSGMAS